MTEKNNQVRFLFLGSMHGSLSLVSNMTVQNGDPLTARSVLVRFFLTFGPYRAVGTTV